MTAGRKFCGKQKHATQSDAYAAAVAHKKTKRRRNGSKNPRRFSGYEGTGAKISVYRCQVCGWFHWGHRVKKSRGDYKKRQES